MLKLLAEPLRPLLAMPVDAADLSSTYCSTFRRTLLGICGDKRIRLITLADGPALLSWLSKPPGRASAYP